MDLRSIPGVGEATAEALSELDDPAAALDRGDVATLASAPGISEGRAARLARQAIRARHDEDGEFLATARAHEVYDDLLALLKDRAVTAYGRKRLETFYPSTSDDRIEDVRSFVSGALARDLDDGIADALSELGPVRTSTDVTIRDRCLATTDAETYTRARDAFPELSVEIVDEARGLADLARGYSTVIALDGAFSGVEVDGDVRVEPDALERPADIVPERSLAFFARNRDRLRAAIAVHRLAGLEAPCDLDGLEDAVARLDEDGGVVGDEELDRLAAAVADLDAAVETAESVADDALRDAIRERDVTIEGTDLLSLVERGAGVDSLLSRELASEYEAAVDDARAHLIDALDLDGGEVDLARRAFPDDPTFPVRHDEAVIQRLRDEVTASRDRRRTELKRELAAELADLREPSSQLIRRALEVDVERAIARFAADFSCTVPTFDGRGFEIEGGVSPLLEEPVAEIEPVDYHVDGVTLLSGVNSGGKTSTLDLVAAIVTLAHMGLPVPAAHARVERVDSLHYVAKSQGTLDAGAFESTLREFGSLATGSGDRLVLVDELESITEPGASAKIVAGILEALSERGATAVFVSHLAREIRDAADVALSVDGIEAVGLEDGELVVTRSPRKDHLARSTPELIVEKLAGEEDAAFYERLLQKFDS